MDVDAPWAVEVENLVKRYPRAERPAVDGLSFSVKEGEVYGLLGPNGAGKTTTVGVLTTRVRPSAGRVRLCGVDVGADSVGARAVLGVVPQKSNLDRSLTVRQNLLFHGRYHRLGRRERVRLADELLERMGLTEKGSSRVDTLSGGQMQRVLIARSLMHRPRVLFLDEPSTGLDPQARLFVHERVAELGAQGVTVILTTHDMHEATELSDRVGIVDRGKLLAEDTPSALARTLPGKGYIDLLLDPGGGRPEDLGAAVRVLAGVRSVEESHERPLERLRIHADVEPHRLVAGVLMITEHHGALVHELDVATPTLEDVFLHLTGRALR